MPHANHQCRKTKTFIETVCEYWFIQFDIKTKINKEDVLNIIIKYGLTKDAKQNMERGKFNETNSIHLKVVIEGDKQVGKTYFADSLQMESYDDNNKRLQYKKQRQVYAKFDDVSVSINIDENNKYESDTAYTPPPDIVFILFEATKYEKMLTNIKEWPEYKYIKECECECIIVGTKLDELIKMNDEYKDKAGLEKIRERIRERCNQHKRVHFGGFVSSTTRENVDIVFYQAVKRLMNGTDIESCVICGSHFEPK